MKKAFTILYTVKNGLYINLTNRCPCSCTFCLRQADDGVYGSEPLWLIREPDVSEVIDELNKIDLNRYEEIVFCGYGEPTERLHDLLKISEYIKSVCNIPIRVNTNGLSDLIYGYSTAPLFVGKVDTLSISLNAVNEEKYLEVTRSKFGIKSFDALKTFTRSAVECGLDVVMTVVDIVTTPEEQTQARQICTDIGARLRIRPLE